MSYKINLILGSHNHVPYGAGDDEFETTYETKLKPFVSTLYKYPGIQAALHYSGVLLHWIERTHPEFIMLIGDLVSRKQVELLGGGFYEPMMPLIPLQDKIGQIEFLTTYLRRQFGKRPQGCWLPALAWEQNMVSPLSASGMGYTFLAEEQFIQAGLEGMDLFSPCVTEDQGKIITVFPLLNSVRYELTRKKASDVFKALSEKKGGDGELTVSVFPETLFSEDAARSPEYVFHQFFEELSLCAPFVECTGPLKFYKGLEGLKKAYFPDSLGCRPLTGKNAREIPLRPRQCLISRPEANGIYSKMIFTHTLINQLRGDKSRKRTAREELWKAQGADVFYPPEERGLRRPLIRSAAYRALLEAERMTREKGNFIPSLMNFDFDMDGEGEFLFQDTKINCYIQNLGASVFELDFLPKTWNYLDTYSLSQDCTARRTAFTDCLFPEDVTPESAGKYLTDFSADSRRGEYRNCGVERYKQTELDRAHGKLHFRLGVKSGVFLGNIAIEKRYSLRKDTLTVSYTLANMGPETERFQFAPVIDLSFPGDGDVFLRLFKCKAGVRDTVLADGIVYDADAVKLQDLKNEVQIVLASKKPFNASVVPVRSPDSQYQSTCIAPLQSVSLNPDEKWDTEFSLKIAH
ncbi:MAG: DUF1926 domain-containing protein [Treponema sp.]|jgi:hypothetical protein|nr:DUF1926 domain-containing protein [Treponema sp.]